MAAMQGVIVGITNCFMALPRLAPTPPAGAGGEFVISFFDGNLREAVWWLMTLDGRVEMRPVGDSGGGGGEGRRALSIQREAASSTMITRMLRSGLGRVFLEQILGLTQEQSSLTEESRQVLEGLKKVAAEIGGVPFERAGGVVANRSPHSCSVSETDGVAV